ncbi:MAG: ArnT family glycosyltransferase [Anaerolineales bacterium]
MKTQEISQKQNNKLSLQKLNGISIQQWLFLIIAVAVVLRLFSAIYQGNQVVALPGIWDQLSYDGLAQRVVAGYGFNFAEGHWPVTRAGEPTAHWSYLYTMYLAVVYAIFGHQPVVARVIQAIVAGALQIWLTWRIGRRIFGSFSGLVAAVLSAIYIYFFYYGGSLLTESFYIVGILWSLDLAMRIVEESHQSLESKGSKSSKWLWIQLGLAIGVTVLLRQVFLLFLPFLFLWIWWNITRPSGEHQENSWGLHKTAVIGLLISTLVMVMMIIPWTIRNYRAFNMFVPLNTNAGFAFYWGNHPIHGTNFIPIITTEGYQDLIPKELLPLSEAEIDRDLLKLGLGFIKDDPVRFILLSISRAKEYFKFWPSSDSGIISNISRVGSFGLALPFMLYGLWLSFKLVRNPQFPEQAMQIILLYMFMVVYTGIHLVSWTLIRYRLPIDAVLLIFAGFAITHLLELLGFDTQRLKDSSSYSSN